MKRVEIIGLEGIPEVREGDDLASLIVEALRLSKLELVDGDVLVVSQKVVSKAEGQVLRDSDVEPSPFAQELSRATDKTAEHLEVILRNTARIVRMDRERSVFIMETPQGFVCANAGVDRSNVGEKEAYTALPADPDGTANRIRDRLEKAFSARLAVIISDSFGRAWRRGQTDVTIGVSGMRPFLDYRGRQDPHGYELTSTMMAVADEIAAAAELVKGKVDRVPIVLIRGAVYEPGEGTAREIVRSKEEDLFR